MSDPLGEKRPIALYRGAKDNVPEVEALDWAQLVEFLTYDHRTGCDAPTCIGKRCEAKKQSDAWSPVDIGEKRGAEHVKSVSFAVFDVDGVDPQPAVERIEAGGYACIVHSTHSHRPESPSYRLTLALSRAVTPAEWVRVRAAAQELFGLVADPATENPAFMFFLGVPTGIEREAGAIEGKALDVDALLAQAPTAAPTPAPVQAPRPEALATDVHALAGELRKHCKPANKALMSRALKGEPLSPPSSGPYGGQDAELQALMSSASFIAPNDTPWEAIEHIFRPCFAATEWGEGTEHLVGEARKKFERARARKVERDTARLAQRRAVWERLGLREPTGTPKPVDEGEEDPSARLEREIKTFIRNGVPRIYNYECNAKSVLMNAPEWQGAIRFNEVSKDLEIIGGPLRGTSPDALPGAITMWFQQSEWGDQGLTPKPEMVRTVLSVIAGEVRYNPVQEYLNGLRWDGVPRLDRWLKTYLGAEGEETYLRAVGSRWLISAVARALQPGSKVDTVLILEGPQGLKKSTAFHVLGGEWFTDAAIDIRNKDSWALASQFWVLEFAELQDIRRSDVETLKAFVSRREDTYRPPYGKANMRVRRGCLFVGTTNSTEYLRYDESGQRRYWCVKCTNIDVPALQKDRDQLWAEAVVRYRLGEQWWLTDAEAALATSAALERTENPIESKQEAVLTWLLRMAPENRPHELHVRDVATGAFGLTDAQLGQAVDHATGSVLRSLGFVRREQSVAGVRRRIWRLPDDLRNTPTLQAGQKPSPLRAMPPAANQR